MTKTVNSSLSGLNSLMVVTGVHVVKTSNGHALKRLVYQKVWQIFC